MGARQRRAASSRRNQPSPPEAPSLAQRPRPAAGQPVLEVQGLRKQFGGLVAVNDITFTVRAGEIMGLIDPNGAGKSTTFNLVSGRAARHARRVRFLGESIAGL